jgi:hypothetical protein
VTPWVVAALLAGFALGGLLRKRELAIARGERRQFEALCDELEVELDKALVQAAELDAWIPIVFDAGIVQGQLLRDEREAEGLSRN